MSAVKDLYIEEVERICSELEDAGMHPDAAYDLASEQAHEAVRNRLADMADAQRQRTKDERL